jgi:hypothetical protein
MLARPLILLCGIFPFSIISSMDFDQVQKSEIVKIPAEQLKEFKHQAVLYKYSSHQYQNVILGKSVGPNHHQAYTGENNGICGKNDKFYRRSSAGSVKNKITV